MKRWILFLSLAICILVSGCTHSGGGSWVRKDTREHWETSPEQLQRDYQECDGRPLQAYVGSIGWNLIPMNMKQVKQCMREKGYEWKEEIK